MHPDVIGSPRHTSYTHATISDVLPRSTTILRPSTTLLRSLMCSAMLSAMCSATLSAMCSTTCSRPHLRHVMHSMTCWSPTCHHMTPGPHRGRFNVPLHLSQSDFMPHCIFRLFFVSASARHIGQSAGCLSLFVTPPDIPSVVSRALRRFPRPPICYFWALRHFLHSCSSLLTLFSLVHIAIAFPYDIGMLRRSLARFHMIDNQ